MEVTTFEEMRNYVEGIVKAERERKIRGAKAGVYSKEINEKIIASEGLCECVSTYPRECKYCKGQKEQKKVEAVKDFKEILNEWNEKWIKYDCLVTSLDGETNKYTNVPPQRCEKCNAVLMYSARTSGRNLCGPCQREADGEETEADKERKIHSNEYASKVGEIVEELLASEMLEYHNSNWLDGDNKQRCERRMDALKEALRLLGYSNPSGW